MLRPSHQSRFQSLISGATANVILSAPLTISPRRRVGLLFGRCASTIKVSALSLISQKRKNKKFTMVTAYDYPSSVHVTRAGMDIILVGDSVGMVELGYDTTQPVTMDDMLHHCGTVKRGVDFAIQGARSAETDVRIPLLVADMPLGSYEYRDTDIALRNAYRFIKETGMDAVKLEVRIIESLAG